MTVTNVATPIIDLNTIRSILYLGLKGDVALTRPRDADGERGGRPAAVTAAPRPAAAARAGGVDTWA